MKTTLKEIIKQAIDIHVHIGPEIIPRKYTVQSLINKEKGRIGGFVLKNHFYATTSFIKEVIDKKGLKIIGSVALNNGVGGLNPDAVYAASLMADGPFFVWFPTINAQTFLNNSKYEIAPEWVNNKNFKGRSAKDVQPVKITDGNKLSESAVAVLKAIKKHHAILATGHISWQESVLLVEKAVTMGIKKIVLTHPIYQRINMPITVQKKLAKRECFIEQCYSMYSIDKIRVKKIANQIKEVGSNFVILSSDVGQIFSPPPSEALYIYATLLMKEGISEDELFTMLVKNPRILLSA